MNRKRAFVTGVSGQDGSYLLEHLLDLDYEVWGMVRRNSVTENQSYRIDHLRNNENLNLEYGDLLDLTSIERIIKLSKPDEIYNLAAQSHVRVSSDVPIYTMQANCIGVANMLEAYKNICPKSKFYQASTSEIFGNNMDTDGYQRETTRRDPVSPYGCAKDASFNLVRYYRRAFGLFTCNGILHNHESPRRGCNFVTQKVVKGAVEISLGLQEKLPLGNLEASRDWGHAKDYVKAMWLILNHDKPDDYTIATGKSHTIRDLCEYVFNKLGMNYKDYVVQDPRFMRPEELYFLKGDSSKARKTLNWEPEYTFESMLDEMIDYWKKELSPQTFTSNFSVKYNE